MSKLDDLGAWKVFESLCRTKSFSATADEFDLEVSTVSRAIASLEKAVGQEFFTHNTRPLQLTTLGETAKNLILPILSMHRELVTELHQSSTSLEGRIRLSLAQGLVERYLLPMLMEFNSLYPDVNFDVTGNGNISDILQYRADIAVVSVKPKDPRLVCFSRGRNVYVPVASPSYIEEYGKPKEPRDLIHHRGLQYDGAVRKETKELVNGDRIEPIVWDKVVKIGNIVAIQKSVLNGLGVSVDLPLLHCAKEISEGRLVPILDGWVKPPVQCFIVTSQSNWHVRRHRIFMEWFRERLKAFFLMQEEMVKPYWNVPNFSVVNEA